MPAAANVSVQRFSGVASCNSCLLRLECRPRLGVDRALPRPLPTDPVEVVEERRPRDFERAAHRCLTGATVESSDDLLNLLLAKRSRSAANAASTPCRG